MTGALLQQNGSMVISVFYNITNRVYTITEIVYTVWILHGQIVISKMKKHNRFAFFPDRNARIRHESFYMGNEHSYMKFTNFNRKNT